METAIKIISAVLPVIIELIKDSHPGISEDEHKQLAQDIFNSVLKK